MSITTDCTCWKLTLVNASVYGFTDHNKDLTVDGQLYVATVGYVPSAMSQSADLAVDNMEITAMLSDAGIKEVDLLAGLFDFARVEVFSVDWLSPGAGVKHRFVTGRLGQVSVEDGLCQFELVSLTQQLQKSMGEVYSASCQAALGDGRCKIVLLPPVWTSSAVVAVDDEVRASVYDARRYVCTVGGITNDIEGEPAWDTVIDNTTVENDGVEWVAKDARTKNFTVTSVVDNRQFADGTRLEADGEFDSGLVSWLTGLNAGYRMDVKQYLLTGGAIALHEPMPFVIAVGDTGTITQGCDKSDATCKDRFDNLLHFRGFPHVPGQQKLIRGPWR